ncbi:SCO2322 family protein [Streptomyces sp. PAL114]|uniref:SCO2322 family protein n=1 Tax=Streptomyces sp. PAL114 TaxID=2970893 RepID=UPI0028FDB9A7|nr:SCO2322 family protein [Streptomyces sp. PAL114]MDU0301442.1 SCO2322 family protein [Streptomyces sp. PAL114]
MTRRVTLLFLAALLPLLAGAGQAQAVGYRYWSFWERDGGAWTYATVGPSLVRPADGSVQGFRFSVSEDSGDAAKPRGTASFDEICAKTPQKDGAKRVALVVDFGTPADAPSGEKPPAVRTACAQVPEDASTAEALASVAKPLRYDSNAMLCAIEGYPAKGCGEQVALDKEGASSGARDDTSGRDSTQDSAREGGGSGPSVGLIAGAAAVIVLGAAAVWQVRRRA